jgi:hypothetical protein
VVDAAIALLPGVFLCAAPLALATCIGLSLAAQQGATLAVQQGATRAAGHEISTADRGLVMSTAKDGRGRVVKYVSTLK